MKKAADSFQMQDSEKNLRSLDTVSYTHLDVYKRQVPYGGWHGTTDFSTVWLGISALVKWLGLPGAIIAIILMLLIPQIQYAKSDKENYF